MKKVLLFFCAAAIFAACQKGTPATPDELTLDPTTISAPADGTTATITVKANCKWEVANTETWITVTPASGEGNASLSVVIAPNNDVERSGSFTVKGGSLDPVTVSVSQAESSSALSFGAPVFGGALYKGVVSEAYVEIPYTGSNGREKVEFTLGISETVDGSGAAKGLKETATSSYDKFEQGSGTVKIALEGTPTTFGLVSIEVKADGTALGEALQTRVEEKLPYNNYVCWNTWAKGYTRSDFCYVAGSQYDKSWTTMGLDADKAKSTSASDHIVLPTHYSADYAEAYLTAVAAKPITAGGTYTLPKTTASLAGYTFNPGIQIQGLAKDDYLLAVIPVKNVAAGTTVSIASSFGGAAKAAGYFILEFSLDNQTWTEVPGAKTITVSDTEYKYHYCDAGSTDKDFRYRYAKDAETDPNYAVYTVAVPNAVSNASLYLRLRAVGLNGNGEAMTATGWSDMKFLEIFY